MPRKRKDVTESRTNDAASYNISRNLSELFGMRISTTKLMISLINGASIHRIAEACLEYDTGLLDTATIELPYIGTISVRYADEDIIVEKVSLSEEYKEMVIDAMRKGESPLLKISEDRLLKKLQDRYDSLV